MNNDGRPDVIRVTTAGRLICRTVDLNFDGRPEVREFYDDAGLVRRRQVDMDMDGLPDRIEIYENGQTTERGSSLSGSGRIDYWEMLTDEKLVQTAWDRNGDGRVDEWRVHGSPGDPDSAAVHTDADGDGFADTGSPPKAPQ